LFPFGPASRHHALPLREEIAEGAIGTSTNTSAPPKAAGGGGVAHILLRLPLARKRSRHGPNHDGTNSRTAPWGPVWGGLRDRSGHPSERAGTSYISRAGRNFASAPNARAKAPSLAGVGPGTRNAPVS